MHDIMAINVALITGKVIFDKTPYVLYRQHGNNVLGYSHKKIQIGKWIHKLSYKFAEEKFEQEDTVYQHLKRLYLEEKV